MLRTQQVAAPPPHVPSVGGAVRIPTVAADDPAADDPPSGFADLHAHLERSFPRAHAALRRESVGTGALLYTWTGADAALAPIVLMGHMDVVPVEAGTEPAWTQPPFGGRIAEGFIWGRGTLDDKVTVLGVLEAVEALLREG